MSDAQMDTGETGGDLQDSTSEFLGEKSDAEAVRYYGWYGLIHSVGTVLVYISVNDNYYVALASAWFLSQIWFFAPVGFGWLMLSYFDGELMREIFKKVV